MIQTIKDRWNGLNFIQKTLTTLALPLIIALLLTKAGRALIFKVELNKQAAVQKESDKLDVKLDAQKIEVAKIEGHIEQLEKDKHDAVEKAKTDDPVDFYNNRYKPTDK